MAFDSGMNIRLGAIDPTFNSSSTQINLAEQLQNIVGATMAPVPALLNAARAQGADSGLIAQLSAQHDNLRHQIDDTLTRFTNLSESEATAVTASLAAQAQDLKTRAVALASERPLTGPVLWGAAVILAAVGVTYAVWRVSKKRRKRRR